jgi:hypothetical protein
MHFILSPPSINRKTPSLSLRLRVARLRLGKNLFLICSVFIAWLFLVRSVFVPQGINAANYYRDSHG